MLLATTSRTTTTNNNYILVFHKIIFFPSVLLAQLRVPTYSDRRKTVLIQNSKRPTQRRSQIQFRFHIIYILYIDYKQTETNVIYIRSLLCFALFSFGATTFYVPSSKMSQHFWPDEKRHRRPPTPDMATTSTG